MQITKQKDIKAHLGLMIVSDFCPTAEDCINNGRTLETDFTNTSDFPFLTTQLTDPAKYTEEYKGNTVEFTYGVDPFLHTKNLVEDHFDDAKLQTEITNNTDIAQYNFNTEDKADLIKDAKSYALTLTKKLCKLFGQYLNEEYTKKYNITAETVFLGPEFSVLGYFGVDAEGNRSKAILINDERLASKMQQDSKFMQRSGERSEEIRQDMASVEGTPYETSVIDRIQPIVVKIPEFGKQLADFARKFKAIKTKSGAKRIKRIASNTIAQSELPEDNETKEETDDTNE